MSNADSWSNVYILLFQFGSSIGKEKIGSGVKPTYIYPKTLNRGVRSLLPSHVVEYDDPKWRRQHIEVGGDNLAPKARAI